jgi:hypothetical protein
MTCGHRSPDTHAHTHVLVLASHSRPPPACASVHRFLVASAQGHYRFGSSTRPPEDAVYNRHPATTPIKFTRTAADAAADPTVAYALEQADR